jgi:NAD(P)-dependent dehydrogenase (short-subunit alcohol dehydrogenase family)
MTATLDRTALVTGATSGIGHATALRLLQLGYTVYGAGRRVERLNTLAETGVRPLEMDVTDDASVMAGVQRIMDETGRIDVLVNNAGYGSYGALEDVPQEEARRQFDVNVFAVVRLIQLVLPHMRARRSGTIINISSVGGRVHSPFGGWYHGTKHAIEGISDCLRIETAPFGINVVVIEPGGIATEWPEIAAEHLRTTSGDGPYAKAAAGMAKSLTDPAQTKRNASPAVVAEAIAKAVTAKRPKTRYAIGFGARPMLLLRRIIPDRMFDRIILSATGSRMK